MMWLIIPFVFIVCFLIERSSEREWRSRMAVVYRGMDERAAFWAQRSGSSPMDEYEDETDEEWAKRMIAQIK